MSKRIMTKLNIFSFAVFLIFGINKLHADKQVHLTQLSKSCMAIESNLPMNHAGHPCSRAYSPNESLWSWLSGDSQSAHLHFLDLTELIQANLHSLSN